MVKIFWSLGGGGINQLLFRHLSDLTEGISSIDHKVLAANGNFSVISGFSIDQIRQKIYWTTFQGRMTPPSNSFFCADIDLQDPAKIKNQVLLKTGGNFNNPGDMFIDFIYQKMYWINTNDFSLWVGDINLDQPAPPINEKQIAIGNNLSEARGLFIDAINHKIYWICTSHKLYVADLNAQDPSGITNEVLLASGGNLNALSKTVCLDIDGQTIYWGNSMSAQIFKANIDPKNPTSLSNEQLFYAPGGGRITCFRIVPDQALIISSDDLVDDEVFDPLVNSDVLSSDIQKDPLLVIDIPSDLQNLPPIFEKSDISSNVVSDLINNVSDTVTQDMWVITDALWNQLRGLLPPIKSKKQDNRLFLEAVCWVLRSRKGWRYLPSVFSPWKTLYGRYYRWSKKGYMEPVLLVLKSINN